MASGYPSSPPAPVRAPAWASPVLEAMAAQGHTRASMAAQVGLSPAALGRRLAGRVRPLTSEMLRLAEALDLSPSDLWQADGGHLREAEGRQSTGPDLELLTERDRRVYAAGHEMADGPALGPAALRGLVDDVLQGDFWQAWVPEVTEVEVVLLTEGNEDTPAWHQARWGPGRVTHHLYVPVWASRPLVVLHELAHVAVHPILWAKPHGPQFLRLWVDLVAEQMGRGPAAELRQGLGRAGLGLASRPRIAAQASRGRLELSRLLGIAGDAG